MNTKKALVVATLLSTFSVVAQAKTLYVNNSGSPTCSDATTYTSNSSTNPWCTIGRAAWGSTSPTSPNGAQAAQAGDVVLINAGTYTTAGVRTPGSGSWWTPALNPANSGTSGSPITFRGVGAVDIRLAAGYSGSLFGADIRNYIIWDNVRTDESQWGGIAEYTGLVIAHECTGCQIINSYIRGNNSLSCGDNYSAIRLEATNNVLIRNTTIRNMKGPSSGHNCSGISLYDTQNLTVEHNDIRDVDAAVYIKGDHGYPAWPQKNNTFRRNRIEDCRQKAFLSVAGEGARIYQNIIKDCFWAYRMDTWPDNASANIWFINNTVIATAGGLGDDAVGFSAGNASGYTSGDRIWNNIFYGPLGEVLNMGYLENINGLSYEHNVYYNFRSFGSVNGSVITLTQFKTTWGQENAPPSGVNSDPLFADLLTYKLRVDSPALARGIDILDLDGDGATIDTISAGAYVTGNETIGLISAPATALSAPRNLRIQ